MIIATALGGVAGLAAHMLWRVHRHRTVDSEGAYIIQYNTPGPMGELMVHAKLNGIEMPMLIDTGFAGPAIVNTHWIEAVARSGPDAWSSSGDESRLAALTRKAPPAPPRPHRRHGCRVRPRG